MQSARSRMRFWNSHCIFSLSQPPHAATHIQHSSDKSSFLESAQNVMFRLLASASKKNVSDGTFYNMQSSPCLNWPWPCWRQPLTDWKLKSVISFWIKEWFCADVDIWCQETLSNLRCLAPERGRGCDHRWLMVRLVHAITSASLSSDKAE